jgi:flagellar hook-associated protein 2
MSTSGINLSALLSALGSSSSGINVTSAVDAAMEAIEQPEVEWENDQATLQTQTSDLNSVETDVETLESSLTALSDPTGALASMSVTSSDTNVVQASAANGTAAGTHVVVVNNLATAASWYSNSVASSSTTLASGSFTLQVGSGTATTIQIGSGNNTLTELASTINAQNLGVTASVVTDSSGARLAIVSSNTGSANAVAVSGASGLTFTQASQGKDASLTVDGIPIDSASNTVTGAVSGLTLNLVGANSGEQVSVSIAPDASAVEQAINSFVSAYNTAIGDVNTQYTLNANNQEGPLAGDATIQMLQNSLLSAGSYSGGGNGVQTLGDLGITMNKDGTLTLDSATLDSAVQNNFSAVQNFLLGTSSNGFVSFLNTQLNQLTAAGNGAFTIDLQSIATQNTDLQTEINNFQPYLTQQQQKLTQEYNQADITLQEIPEEEAQINAELGYTPSSSSTNGV